MDQEKSPNRTKRQTKVSEDYWDCSVCTYRNTAEAFKCSMCDIRKGTSTRKPRINPQLVAQQAAPQFGGPPPVKVLKKEDKDSDEEEEKEKEKEKEKPMDGKKEKPTEGKKRKNKEGKSAKKAWRTPRLKNVDRSTAQTREITVNNVSVLITEYKLKKKKTTPASDACSTTSEGSHTDTSTDTRSAEVANDTRSS